LKIDYSLACRAKAFSFLRASASLRLCVKIPFRPTPAILVLCDMPHKHRLCVKSDIDTLSDLAHNLDVNDLARDPKQIGNAIRRARKRRAWSQKTLGDLAALRQETISLLETGNPAAKIETILAVLAALDLELQIAPRSQNGPDVKGYF